MRDKERTNGTSRHVRRIEQKKHKGEDEIEKSKVGKKTTGEGELRSRAQHNLLRERDPWPMLAQGYPRKEGRRAKTASY